MAIFRTTSELSPLKTPFNRQALCGAQQQALWLTALAYFPSAVAQTPCDGVKSPKFFSLFMSVR
jgi:hypothetical protein